MLDSGINGALRALVIQAVMVVIVVLAATIVTLVPPLVSDEAIIPGDALVGLYATALGYIFGAISAGAAHTTVATEHE